MAFIKENWFKIFISLLGIVIFYWFAIRPGAIRSKCYIATQSTTNHAKEYTVCMMREYGVFDGIN